jgi:5-methylcytosine-specific restriction protein A
MFWKRKQKQIIHRRNVSARVKLAVLNRDGWKCQQCGFRTRTRTFLHVDHILPLAAGGTNDIRNLQVLCSSCNLKKGKRVLRRARLSVNQVYYRIAIPLGLLAILAGLILHH